LGKLHSVEVLLDIGMTNLHIYSGYADGLKDVLHGFYTPWTHHVLDRELRYGSCVVQNFSIFCLECKNSDLNWPDNVFFLLSLPSLIAQ